MGVWDRGEDKDMSRDKSKQRSETNPSIDPGEAVILPGGGMLCLAWLPVCASSAGSRGGYSAFNQTLPFAYHSISSSVLT